MSASCLVLVSICLIGCFTVLARSVFVPLLCVPLLPNSLSSLRHDCALCLAAAARNLLYVKADVVFCVSACFYLLGSMRDCGFFAFLPLAGCVSLAAHSALEDQAAFSPSSSSAAAASKQYDAGGKSVEGTAV